LFEVFEANLIVLGGRKEFCLETAEFGGVEFKLDEAFFKENGRTKVTSLEHSEILPFLVMDS